LPEIIAYPGFNLEDVPPEFDNVVSKVVELVYISVHEGSVTSSRGLG
jgi:hypothetical protein